MSAVKQLASIGFGSTDDADHAEDGNGGLLDTRDLSDQPQITPEEEAREMELLSEEERLLAYVDVYGRMPPGEHETDERLLDEFHREILRIPHKRKAALHQGYKVDQARQFLRIEGNDPKLAAERMARYWDLRVRTLGKAAFSSENMLERTEEDLFHMYEMSLKADLYPEVDAETKRWARKFSRDWDRGHILGLDDELGDIHPDEKAALTEAQKSRPDLAASDDHKLLFLRSTDFDSKLAAQRMVNYWDFRLQLFGSDGAFSTLTFDDLVKDYPEVMKMGFLQRLPSTDASGRAILFFIPQRCMQKEASCEGLLKYAWYILHAALEDSACRENGVIVITVAKDYWPKASDINICSQLLRLHCDCIPINVKAIHACAPEKQLVKFIFPVIRFFMGKRMRRRHCAHLGAVDEILSELKECGIREDQVPTELGGSLDLDSLHREWLEQQKDDEF